MCTLKGALQPVTHPEELLLMRYATLSSAPWQCPACASPQCQHRPSRRHLCQHCSSQGQPHNPLYQGHATAISIVPFALRGQSQIVLPAVNLTNISDSNSRAPPPGQCCTPSTNSGVSRIATPQQCGHLWLSGAHIAHNACRMPGPPGKRPCGRVWPWRSQ